MMIAGFVLILILILSVIIIWRLFARAGEAGWKSLIPLYNTYIMIKIGVGKGMTWLLPMIIGGGVFAPLLNSIVDLRIVIIIQLISYVVFIYITYLFYRRFSSKGMSIGAVLIPIIFGAIIAFGDYPYTPIGKNYKEY